jgi:proline iminopeptidase
MHPTGPHTPRPLSAGTLDVGDGNLVYWETHGNPGGVPAVVLHGGPGAGCGPRHLELFDLDRYRVILFDQRGCGRSTPNAGSPGVDLTHNTTWHLIADVQHLRRHLGVDRWTLVGGSWGSTLALAYAQQHPQCVAGIVVCGVTTARRSERDWYWGGGAAHLFPEAWQNLRAAIPTARRDDNVVDVFGDLLDDPHPAVRHRAVAAWDGWDHATMALRAPVPPPTDGPDGQQPGGQRRSGGRSDTDDFATMSEPARDAYAAARLCVHYLRHDAWLPEGGLLRDAAILNGIPGIIVQGRYDVQTPAVTAWELSRVWTTATLRIIQDAGHAPLDPALSRALREATDALLPPR